MGRAAIGEETVGIGIGIQSQRIDPSDTSRGQPRGDITFQIELSMTGLSGGKEALIFRIIIGEARDERFVHLIACPRDARPDRCVDMLAPGTERLHRKQRRIGDPGKRALPSGMGGGDDAPPPESRPAIERVESVALVPTSDPSMVQL